MRRIEDLQAGGQRVELWAGNCSWPDVMQPQALDHRGAK
jgi:hypothetical protein